MPLTHLIIASWATLPGRHSASERVGAAVANRESRYRWVLRLFMGYGEAAGLAVVDEGTVAVFLMERFALSIDAKDVTPCQCVLRKPALALLEYERTGSYGKRCRQPSTRPVPERFSGFYRDYEAYVGSLGLAESTVIMKLTRMRFFIDWLVRDGLEDIRGLELRHLRGWLADGTHSPYSLSRDSHCLREALDWMHGIGLVVFTGRDAFPVVRANRCEPVPSHYTDEEVMAVLAAADTGTPAGKRRART
jgi:hypothetical protein